MFFTSSSTPKAPLNVSATETHSVVDAVAHSFTPFTIDNTQKPFLDFGTAYVEGNERLYLGIYVLGCRLLGLLDSGAIRSILDRPGLDILTFLRHQLVEEQTLSLMVNLVLK